MSVQTDRHISANRPDIIIKDKVNSTCKLIDMTVGVIRMYRAKK